VNTGLPRTDADTSQMEVPVPSVAWHAPAKINLALHVTGRRADGYHLLESLAVFARFGDCVSVAASDDDRFSVSGPFAAGVPTDRTNLVLRARDALRGAFPRIADAPVAIALEKNLPVASGIGGGSSDAAAALHALAGFWRVGDEALARIGLALGADVPMCLAARPLIARGIGEVIDPLWQFPALPLVLVNPGIAVSTPEIFRTLSSPDNPGLPVLPADADFFAACNYLAATRNDLQTPAIAAAPVIGNALQVLDESGAAFARMSGSGATCFGLFETKHRASRAAENIAAAHPGWWVVASESMAAEEEDDGNT
jgi:4-diphosphocytidyl-2-C-methyl-D-erythritol kinase